MIIPKMYANRWKRQMDTAYDELPDDMQDSDRDEAKAILTTIRKRLLDWQNR